MVAVNVVLIFVNRSFSNSLLDFVWGPNTILWCGLPALLLAAILGAPFLGQLFGFGSLHGNDLMLSAAAGPILFGGLEAAKRRLSPLDHFECKRCGSRTP